MGEGNRSVSAAGPVTVATVAEDAGERLDRVLARHLAHRSRASLQKLIAAGQVLVGPPGGPQVSRPASYRMRACDVVSVALPEPEPSGLVAWDAPVPLLRVEPGFLVVDKPAGWVVHPGAGHRERTVVQALLAAFPEIAAAGSASRPGIVHRLDKGTSGAMVVARTAEAYLGLVRQFAAHSVFKEYLAIVAGRPARREQVIDAAIGRDPRNRKRFAVRSDGKPARTSFEIREQGAGYTLLAVRIATGRTHQIRVHLTSLGHPLVGDPVYGRAGRRLAPELVALVEARGGPFLHARRLGFADPASGAAVAVEAPIPSDFQRAWEILRGPDHAGA